jgi:hypothetical protein
VTRKSIQRYAFLILALRALSADGASAARAAPATGSLTTPSALAVRIARVSGGYLGTSYRLDPLGEGPSGDVDRDPLFDRRRVDCLTFVEQVLAEATAPSKSDFMARLQRIRYHDGVVSFRTRNHYTVTDWLPHNAWLVEDVTRALGGTRTERMVKLIDHSAFFRRHGCDPAGAGKDRSETRYIPREAVSVLAVRIPSATLAIFVQRRPGIIAAHCGWLLRLPGRPLILRHASRRHGRVVDEPFLDYLSRQPRNIAGVKLCVIRRK